MTRDGSRPGRLRRLREGLVAAGLVAATLVGGAAEAQQGARLDDALLQKLEGRWDLVREVRGEVVRNTLEASWVLNHQFLQVHMLDTAKPPAYEALVLIGFDARTQEYVAHWTDSWGGEFAAVGRGRRQGDAVEFRFEYPDGPFFNTFRWDATNGSWTFVGGNVDRDGRRVPFLKDRLTRAARDDAPPPVRR